MPDKKELTDSEEELRAHLRHTKIKFLNWRKSDQLILITILLLVFVNLILNAFNILWG